MALCSQKREYAGTDRVQRQADPRPSVHDPELCGRERGKQKNRTENLESLIHTVPLRS
jgi:hypothetical protein